ncbi:MAG: hypothetical protein F6K31_02350 [Symploca sp. SIO2G7]|nr:hypothetical protein [Symploca sp. SIO2G7]
MGFFSFTHSPEIKILLKGKYVPNLEAKNMTAQFQIIILLKVEDRILGGGTEFYEFTHKASIFALLESCWNKGYPEGESRRICRFKADTVKDYCQVIAATEPLDTEWKPQVKEISVTLPITEVSRPTSNMEQLDFPPCIILSEDDLKQVCLAANELGINKIDLRDLSGEVEFIVNYWIDNSNFLAKYGEPTLKLLAELLKVTSS